jgi:hypothetical protein
MQLLSEVHAVIDRAKIHIITFEAFVLTNAHKYKQQKRMDHPLTIIPKSKMMVVPAVPIIIASMRLIRWMVSIQRSAQTASCVSIWACTDAAVGFAISLPYMPCRH